MPVPLISVVMPVYNGAAFVDAAVLSIRSQTLGNLELICIDDGSTDSTQEHLRPHAAADRRVRIVEERHAGVIATLHRGFHEARGAFIARMDADDLSVPSRLERQLDFLAAHPNVMLVGGSIAVIDEQARVQDRLHLPTQPAEIREHLVHRGNCIVHPTVLFRREALSRGAFRQGYVHAEDYDWWLRLSEHADLANLDEVLLYYRRHKGSVSYRHPAQQILSALCARHAALFRAEGKPDPTAEIPLINEETAVALGLTREAIHRTIFEGLIGAARDAVSRGIDEAADTFGPAAAPYASPQDVRRAVIQLEALAVSRSGQPYRRLLRLLRRDSGLAVNVWRDLNFG